MNTLHIAVVVAGLFVSLALAMTIVGRQNIRKALSGSGRKNSHTTTDSGEEQEDSKLK